jgi:hypothetical protein
MENLTLEQQFKIRRFNDNVDKLNITQLQELTKDLFRTSMLESETYKDLLKVKWGLDNPII